MTARSRRPLRRRPAALLAGLALLLAVPACSSDDPSSGGDRTTTTAADGTGTTTGGAGGGPDATVPEPFEGSVEAFYEVPDPLPAGEPGDVIRLQPIEADGGDVATRVMYLSEDRTGAPRAVTGTVHHPEGDAPDGGWPILADAHGTTGIIARCAPSRLGLVPADHGVAGVRVMTDYIGLGPEGELHPYLSTTAEANALLDSLVATRNLLGEQVSNQVVIVGHSQGGHAALVSSERLAERTPDFELLGTVAVAPGAQFTESYGDDIQLRIIMSMIVLGSGSEWPDVDPAEYFAPDVYEQVRGIVLENCLDRIVPEMIPIAVDPGMYQQDPRTSGPAAGWAAENDAATRTFDAPLLLITGGRDITVVPARVEGLRERLCDIGQQTEYTLYPEADHSSEPAVAAEEIDAWVQARLAGEPATDDCAELDG